MAVVAERRAVMNLKTDEYWGTLLLEMAHDAREDGDFPTAELLTAAAMKYITVKPIAQRCVGENSRRTPPAGPSASTRLKGQ